MAASSDAATTPLSAFRPPAVPLVTTDPYFSVWSTTDQLPDDWSRHWTGATQALAGIVRVDGQPYRVMGREPDVPEMTQTSLQVLPTRTIYRFEARGVEVTLTFTTPLLPEDLDVLSHPLTYVTWEFRATDAKRHSVSFYQDATAEWAVNTTDQKVTWSRYKVGDMSVLRMGSQEQPILEKKGDNLRIDWGYLYLAAKDEDSKTDSILAGGTLSRRTFAESGHLPEADDLRMPRSANDDWPVAAFAFDMGEVGEKPVSRTLLLAYDDLFSIEYLNRRLRPYWRKNGWEAADLLRAAERDYASLSSRCKSFDEAVLADLSHVGGEEYARLGSLAYRQCIAAHKLTADVDGRPMFFSKENFSNGCIDTVDVTYPSSPFFLLFAPELLKAQLTPVLDYAGMERWRFPFAPHDLGTYPLANGQVYGGGEKNEENQMPVEESGNMLLMVAALAKTEGNAAYAEKYWGSLQKWAEYLKAKGLDPENQLCTDDFAGHLAHNVNLSLKAILALGAYGQLCEKTGRKDQAEEYRKTAQEFARRWMEMADDGDHYRLAFDKPGTWSQKYNLVWDQLLGLNLFPAEVARKEIAYYKTQQNAYGLPLDNRRDYTKLDWIFWTATLAESPGDFRAFVFPAYKFADETPSRVPLTDWYGTVDGKKRGFQARSVVGGIFIKLLSDEATWKKWSRRTKKP
jgi:hypothetical protein